MHITEERVPGRTTTTSESNQGFVKIRCGINGCSFTHRFTETEVTVTDPITTRRYRREYIAQVHRNGGHRVERRPIF